MINKGKYYWKFKSLIPEVLGEQSQCMVCGSTSNLNIHHMLHCNSFEPKYSDKHNLVVMCRSCHNEYHRKYSKATPVTLLEFIRNKYLTEYSDEVDGLRRELREYQDLLNFILQME